MASYSTPLTDRRMEMRTIDPTTFEGNMKTITRGFNKLSCFLVKYSSPEETGSADRDPGLHF